MLTYAGYFASFAFLDQGENLTGIYSPLVLGRYRGSRGPGRDSAVHPQRLPGNIAAGFRSQEHDCPIQIVRLPGTLHRNAIDQIINPLLIFVENLGLLGADPAWRQ